MLVVGAVDDGMLVDADGVPVGGAVVDVAVVLDPIVDRCRRIDAEPVWWMADVPICDVDVVPPVAGE